MPRRLRPSPYLSPSNLEARGEYFNRKITGSLIGTQPFSGFNLSGNNAKAGGPDYRRLFMEMKTVSEKF
ncbi:MAG: hypothetical protein KGZ60_09920 [Truepera sp.]|nr:hypothetical protein [Truepera sp.]